MAMDLTSYTLAISKISTHSTVSSPNAAHTSVISWRHVCWDMTKTPAGSGLPSTTVWLQESKTLTTYTDALSGWSDPNLCGPYTYAISYNAACGGFNEPPADPSVLASGLTINTAGNTIDTYLDRSTYKSFVDTSASIGCYTFDLETTYGIYGSESTSFTLTLSDPCD